MKTVNQAAHAQLNDMRKATDKVTGSNAHVAECRERVIEALTDETTDMTNVEAMAMLHGLIRDINAIRLAATT